MAGSDHGHLQTAAGATDPQTVCLEDIAAKRRHLGGGSIDVLNDLVLRSIALRPGGERHDHEGAVGRSLTRNREDVLDLAIVPQGLKILLDPLQLVTGIGEARSLRCREPHQDDRAVLAWRDLALDHREGKVGGARKHAGHDNHDQRVAKAGAQAAAIEACKPLPEGTQQSILLLALAREHARRHHRAERECRDRGQENGKRKDEAEFAEETAELPRQKGKRNEDRGERRRGREDREEDFLRAKHGSRPRPHALGASTHDVLEHHDRIVDDKTGGKNNREQGQDVDREADEIDRNQGPDQRNRHGKRRDQRRPPVAEEEVKHDQHDDGGEAERDLHLVQRALDEDGVVAGDNHPCALGQSTRHGIDSRMNASRDVQRIRLSLTDDAETDTLYAVRPERRRAVIRAEGNRCDIA